MNDFFDKMEESNFLQELSDEVMRNNPELNLAEPEYNVILYADGEYKENDVRIEFCDAVTDFGRDGQDYRFRKVPGFTALNILHKGPYHRLPEAYDYADQWMKKNGYEKVGCPRNSAIDGFWNREREEDYLTEIQIPVKSIKPFLLPSAEVEKLFYLECELHPDIPVGDVGRGHLMICPIKGGFFKGEKLRGEVLDFGADWNLMYYNYLNIVDTRYLLRTDDGEIISLTTNGRAVIEPEMDQAIERGEYVDPKQYYFRQHLFFETGSEKYKWLNGIIAFAILGCKPTGEICYDAYMLK
jgi:effector-binding domain-containing protein